MTRNNSRVLTACAVVEVIRLSNALAVLLRLCHLKESLIT